ncbi:MAG: pYEATS domain-containing protein [Gemmatimonadaceae bacterium]
MSKNAQAKLRLAQSEEYQGEDWWHWRVWLKGDKTVLDRVDRVVYQLHPTFSEPVRRINDRSDSFGLEAQGWGTFTIHARVEMKDGTSIKLKHDLELTYPDGTKTEA